MNPSALLPPAAVLDLHAAAGGDLCTFEPDGWCHACGVSDSDPCPDCTGRGYCRAGCRCGLTDACTPDGRHDDGGTCCECGGPHECDACPTFAPPAPRVIAPEGFTWAEALADEE